ncbi:sugar kinase [Pseudarthrobacter sp. R1]|uniref:sugar kinase n=1 Tax=Pseudarthrobacter sp. R1 TaxID=2944934 RepID=UPI00210BF8A7|nr:sugar kinase [Pseudarthrobacter sp. R1]MCQ6273348.1 sugar kinase [Pseudarthrobacter sp. R1]
MSLPTRAGAPDAREPSVVCVGETMAVVAPASTESLTVAEQCLLGIGGAESNVAAQLAELGIAAAWAGRVGNDPFGERILRVLAGRGVDVSRAEVDANAPTGVYFKEPDTGAGARTLYYRQGSAASLMEPDAVSRWGLATVPWVHVSGINAALSPGCRSFLEGLFDVRSALGAPTSFDVNYRSALWPAGDAAPVLLELARRADVVLVGLDEANVLWGCATVEDVAGLLSEPAHLVVKDGGTEAVEFVRNPAGVEEVHRTPARAVEVIEPVGAGDAFAAGYLAGLLRGATPTDRLSLGHSVAAWTLGTRGDFRPGHGLTAPQPAHASSH